MRTTLVKHFTSWLGLRPGTTITGGKVMSGKTGRVVNHAAAGMNSYGARPCMNIARVIGIA